jgi:hypothetical protein
MSFDNDDVPDHEAAKDRGIIRLVRGIAEVLRGGADVLDAMANEEALRITMVREAAQRPSAGRVWRSERRTHGNTR